MDNETLELLLGLAGLLATAKEEEQAAKRKRIAVEDRIVGLVPGPDRGQKTVKLENGMKIVVERELNYKADCKKIEEIFAEGGETRFAPIKIKTTRELDVLGYEYYREHDTEMFSLLSQCVTIAPKKVSVTLKAGK